MTRLIACLTWIRDMNTISSYLSTDWRCNHNSLTCDTIIRQTDYLSIKPHLHQASQSAPALAFSFNCSLIECLTNAIFVPLLVFCCTAIRLKWNQKWLVTTWANSRCHTNQSSTVGQVLVPPTARVLFHWNRRTTSSCSLYSAVPFTPTARTMRMQNHLCNGRLNVP